MVTCCAWSAAVQSGGVKLAGSCPACGCSVQNVKSQVFDSQKNNNKNRDSSEWTQGAIDVDLPCLTEGERVRRAAVAKRK